MQSPESFDDLLALDRSERPRKLAGLPGHYKLQGWKDSEGRSRQFPCEILKISPHAIKFSASVMASVGDWIEVYFEHLGRFEGPVIQASNRAIAMRIFGTNDDRLKVASRLAWVADAGKAEGRRYPRFTPTSPQSSIALPGLMRMRIW